MCDVLKEDKISKLFILKAICNMNRLCESISDYHCKKYKTSFTFRDLDMAEHIMRFLTDKRRKLPPEETPRWQAK